jgi:hypothetical protein
MACFDAGYGRLDSDFYPVSLGEYPVTGDFDPQLGRLAAAGVPRPG